MEIDLHPLEDHISVLLGEVAIKTASLLAQKLGRLEMKWVAIIDKPLANR